MLEAGWFKYTFAVSNSCIVLAIPEVLKSPYEVIGYTTGKSLAVLFWFLYIALSCTQEDEMLGESICKFKPVPVPFKLSHASPSVPKSFSNFSPKLVAQPKLSP